MNNYSRVENCIRNISISLIGQVLSLIISFVNRTVFISTLGDIYLGVNGLFTSILSVLSVAELGVGNAIIYNMYKPLAENDTKKLKGLMKLYARAYKIIGTVVGVIGIFLIPFLKYIIKENTNIPNINIIYCMFLLNSVLSYFFSYKRSILIADQKSYIVNNYQFKYNIVQLIIQIIILKITRNFLLYLIAGIIFSVLINILISRSANKNYPYICICNDNYLSKEEVKGIFKNICAIFMYKFSAIIINSTDNIVIASFIGTSFVGLYSNYLLLINSITMILSTIFNSLTASIGNLNASESTKKKYEIYNTVNFISFWMYGFCSICFLVLINSFIELWIGSKYILDNFTVLIIVLNFYTTGMQYGTSTFRDSTGMFWIGRYLPLFAAVINLGVSITLVRYIGIAGVLLGTIISRLCTYFWFDTLILHKKILKRSIDKYFAKYFLYTCTTIFTTIIIILITFPLVNNTWVNFIFKMGICAVVANLVFYFLFKRTSEFKYVLNVVKNMLAKFKLM